MALLRNERMKGQTVANARRARLADVMAQENVDLLLVYGNAWQSDYLRYVSDFGLLEGEGLAVFRRDGTVTLYLDHPLEADPFDGTREASRHDRGHAAVEQAEGRQVEVVAVGVRDEDRVRVSQRLEVDRRSPKQVQHPATKQRVGQQPDAVELDQDRGVPDVTDCGHCEGPGGRPRLSMTRSSSIKGDGQSVRLVA